MRPTIHLDGSTDQVGAVVSTKAALVPAKAAPTLADIQPLLAQVFEWEYASSYAFYLLDLPGLPLKIVDNNLAEIDEIAKNGKHWKPFGLQPLDAKVVLSIPPTMGGLPPRYRLCISLDSLGVTVPVAAAQIVSASFATGLVTRLMLQKFGDKSSEDFTDELDLLSPDPAFMVSGYGNSAASFEGRFTEVCSKRPFQQSGFFVGWNAGGAVATASPKVQDALWSLVKSRFDWSELGQLTSYGLGYLLGFLRVQATLDMPNSNAGAGAISDPNQILAKLKDEKDISGLEDIIASFFDELIDAFSKAKLNAPVPQLQNYSGFLSGYQRGGLRAAEDVFVQVLSVGYGLGYRDGFLVGYTRGYADGYRVGYKKGKKTNWGRVISDVASIVKNVATVVAVFG